MAADEDKRTKCLVHLGGIFFDGMHLHLHVRRPNSRRVQLGIEVNVETKYLSSCVHQNDHILK